MDGIFRRRNLPHWDVEGRPVFITGCLQGSISHAGMMQIDAFRNQLKLRPKPDEYSINDWEQRQQKQLFVLIEKLLDHHSPVKHFEDERLAEIITNAFLHFAEVRYSLLAFVVMPSHHHWLFAINEDWAAREQAARAVFGKRTQTPREVISQSIQSYTANACNKILCKTGRFWQQETYDHWARNDEEIHRIIHYIESNPVSAGLVEKPENYRWSSAHYRSLGILPGNINHHTQSASNDEPRKSIEGDKNSEEDSQVKIPRQDA